MLCMQELFFWGGWINWNIASDVYIFTKEKSINAEKNKNVVNGVISPTWLCLYVRFYASNLRRNFLQSVVFICKILRQ